MNIFFRIKNCIVNRWRKAHSPMWQAQKAGLHFGKGNHFYSVFWGSEPYLITIGDRCQITEGVKIFTHGGGHVLRYKIPNFDCFGKVSIGNDVYIGNNAMIMPGVTIGNNVIIAAGAVVCHSVPDEVVVGGNPAKILSSIQQYKEKNIGFNTESKFLSAQDKKKLLELLPDERFIKKRMIR